MPLYDYACADCEKAATKRLKRELTDQEYSELVLFETSHTMSPSPKELKEATTCPRCNKNNCQKSLINSNAIGYIRGNGYLDRDGVRRDMNLFHLTQDDPYAQYRQPGEVDEMKSKLKRGGRGENKKHFVVSQSEMQKAVSDATSPKSNS